MPGECASVGRYINKRYFCQTGYPSHSLPTMSLSHPHSYLSELWVLLKKALFPLIEDVLEKEHGDGWIAVAQNTLPVKATGPKKSRKLRKDEWDTMHLLRLFFRRDEFHPRAEDTSLAGTPAKKYTEAIALHLKKVRNQEAHQSDVTFSEADMAFDAARMLLKHLESLAEPLDLSHEALESIQTGREAIQRTHDELLKVSKGEEEAVHEEPPKLPSVGYKDHIIDFLTPRLNRYQNEVGFSERNSIGVHFFPRDGSQVDNVMLLVLVGVLIGVTLTEVASNTASASILVAILLGVLTAGGAELNLSPVLAVCLATSCSFMLPVATPPNAIVFGTGEVPLREMMRAGLFMNLLCAVILFIAFGVFGLAPAV